MQTRTANAGELLKNFDITHKLTRRKGAEKKLKALKTFLPNMDVTFLPNMDVTAATQQYSALVTSLENSPDHNSILSKLQFALRTEGYKSIVPVFQLTLCLPLDNAFVNVVFPQ